MSDAKYIVYYIGPSTDLADTREELDKIGAHLEVLPSIEDEDEIIAKTKDANGIIVSESPMTRHVMSSLPNCKVVLRTGVGFDVIDVPAATDLGIAVINIPDMWTREVANQAMALMLACNRKLTDLNDAIKSGTWTPRPPHRVGQLHGETAGILGMGRIGSAFARRAKAFELNVIAYDPYISDSAFAATTN